MKLEEVFARAAPIDGRLAQIAGSVTRRRFTQDTALLTGCAQLDLALRGGLPSGVVEIWGAESTGKTGLVGRLLGSASAQGLGTLLCASEVLDLAYLERSGADLNQLVVARSRSFEEMGRLVLDFVGDCRPAFVAIDSLSAFRPLNDDPGVWNEQLTGFLIELGECTPTGSLVVCTSQMRMNGRRPRSQARRASDLFRTSLELGRRAVEDTNYELVVRTWVSAYGPLTQVVLPAVKGWGVNVLVDLLRALVTRGVVERRGQHYFLEGAALGLGEQRAAAALHSQFGMLYERLWA